jgi:predicted dehydrogenase/type 1 glutamine amidotransferase
MIKVLMLAAVEERRGEVRTGIQALAAYLRTIDSLYVRVATASEAFGSLADADVVLADLSQGPLTTEQEECMWAFVQAGGGLVTVGGRWQESSYGDSGTEGPGHGTISLPCADAVYHGAFSSGTRLPTGVEYRRWAPVSEIVARIGNLDHNITRRLDPAFVVMDSFAFDSPPEDAEVLVETSWHFEKVPLAFVRHIGDGQVFSTSLGCADATLAHPVFQQLLYRAMRYTAGHIESRPVGVAMIGYGAIGFEHGTAISQVPGLEYVAVCDRSPARCEAARRAFPGVRTYTELAEVGDDPGIDLVIISTPPNTHAAVAIQMLRTGKHVVSEKPFCLTVAEADVMMETALAQRLTLSVYQNRRWDRDFLAIKRTIGIGLIGEVFHVETFIGGFAHPCEYWHSHEPISGGMVYDWGSHYIDWILDIIPDPAQSVVSSVHKRVWHNVTNADQTRVLIRFGGGQEAEFLQSDIAAALKPKWYILGTKGAIVANWRYETVKSRRWSGDLIEEHLAPAEAPADVIAYIRDGASSIHEQRLALPPAPAYPFHRNLANHLLTGEPLAVTPASSRRNVAVMEAAQRSVASGSTPVSVDC